MDERQQPVRNNPKGDVNNSNISANEIHRIAAKPHQVITKIAKISYTSTVKAAKKDHASKQSTQFQQLEDNSTTIELRKTNTIQHSQNEFAEKKEEREKEFTDLKLYINEIAKNKTTFDDKEKGSHKDNTTLVDNEDNSKKTALTFRRCKTEILGSKLRSHSEGRVKTSVGAKARSKSSQPPEAKSSESLHTTPRNTKRKSYNVEEARKFLEKQKYQRRFQSAASTLKLSNEKTALEKEQIRKRLEDLRKNSRAIITKNVNKKKFSSAKNIETISKPKICTETANKEKTDCILNKPIGNIASGGRKTLKGFADVYDNNKTTQVVIDDPTSTFTDYKIKNASQKDETKVESTDPTKDPKANEQIKGETPNSLYPSKKRIGLLRKKKTKDHSFSAIKEFSYDKENIALEMMTPKFQSDAGRFYDTALNRCDASGQGPSPQQADSTPKFPQSVSDDKHTATGLINSQENLVETTYRNPISARNTLECGHSDELKNIEISKGNASEPINISCNESQSKLENIPQSDLPCWLKQSAVQIYPYNFIMAVRRKLEALADVKQSTHKTTSTKDLPLSKSESGATFVNSEPIEESLKKTCDSESKKSVLEKSFVTHTIETEKGVGQKLIKPRSYTTQSQSELNSNLSSISIQLKPSSNTVSETTSKKSESIPLTNQKSKANSLASEDDTTISSSIFNSPQRNVRHINANIDGNKQDETMGAISPLSLERVENLIITSNKKLKKAIAARHVNTHRGGILENLVHKNNLTHEIDFNKLLDDFNRSLSQVIEVNDRLKTTIDKSQDICAREHNLKRPERSVPKESDEYTEDFEKNSSQRSQNANSDLYNEKDGNNAYFKKRNKIHKNETVESQQSHSGTDGLKEGSSSKHLNQISRSCTNSSLRSFNSNKSSEFSQKNRCPMTEVVSQQDLSKPFHKIEEVKADFKQAILSSQQIRRREDYQWESKIFSSKMGSKTLTMEEQEKSEQSELRLSLDKSPDPANVVWQNENENSDSVTEDIQSECKSGIEQEVESSKLQRKISTTALRDRINAYNQHMTSKYATASQKILEMFDHSSLGISLGSTNNDSLSDSTCSYSNVGLYEKLIRNETTKSEHLTALLKMRQKALFDRTKGQIAWLEVQKERCKAKGLLLQISVIKKKQRGILMKMEKKREEIKRLLQSTTTTTSTESSSANRAAKECVSSPKESDKSVVSQKSISKISHKITQLCRNENLPSSLVSLPQVALVSSISKYARGSSQSKIDFETTRSVPVVRANYGLESSRSLEELLQKRELDLRRRREHVERLMQWHRRLDQEEADVLQMENALLTYSTHKSQYKPVNPGEGEKERLNHAGVVPLKNISTHKKSQRRLKEIEDSLRELNSISSAHTTAGSNEESREDSKSSAVDCVRTTGIKLNKLWRRLTSQQIEKYEPNKHYQLSKPDLERLYEAAKLAVLEDFARNEGRLAAELLEKSISTLSNNISQTSLQKQPEPISVPPLNLCTSSEPSDKEKDSWEETSTHSLLENYSPCTAAKNFQFFATGSSAAILCSTFIPSSFEANILLTKTKSELNLHPSMRNSSPRIANDVGLMRSLSDTVLYDKYRSPKGRKIEILNTYKNNPAVNVKRSMLNTETNLKLPHPSSTSQQISFEQANDSSSTGTEHITVASSLQTERLPDKTTPVKETAEIENCSVSTETLFHTANEELKTTADKQEIQSCSEHISSCIQSSCSSEISNTDIPQESSNCIISTVSWPEQIQNVSNNSVNDTNESFNSKTFVSQPKLIQSEETATENQVLNTYEEDFESTSELTQLDDLSLPHFESIVEISLADNNGNEEVGENEIHIDIENKDPDIDKPICSGASEKVGKTQPISTNPEATPVPPPPPSPCSTDNARLQSAVQSISNLNVSMSVNTVQLMPDIINELEIRRCQQIIIENEQLKQFDNPSAAGPYMYVREIPNKPPPPYVPPAHGSPMTTIFPSEERIREICYRRTHELYCELLKTDYISETGDKIPLVMDEKITNIYERIILDICREYLDEHREVLMQGDPINFHTQLAFFNPPNRLRCIQESVYKEVRRCLAMDKTSKRRTPIYSVYGQRAKRDHIGKIIIQEMYDEDDKWCNFHREENEVVELIIYEMLTKFLYDLAEEVLLEEGGSVEIPNRDNKDESDENINLSSCEAESKLPIGDV
ncbi:uncharacterized protein LOC128865690 [Anastrepha ludens]|uniref:uncharacterized protein LOC128865690 n=1 Tax=Anastrepha ludens TaxID=28586 RepID=UPI0023AEEC54|nr:uncharacterized protein LOC128865690 [Anastrepha ludens]